jgi:hypothetical protein
MKNGIDLKVPNPNILKLQRKEMFARTCHLPNIIFTKITRKTY